MSFRKSSITGSSVARLVAFLVVSSVVTLVVSSVAMSVVTSLVLSIVTLVVMSFWKSSITDGHSMPVSSTAFLFT